jgi:hypothetical protein
MTDLSPAAQAVLDAYFTEADRLDREVSDNEMIAAALRAAVEIYAEEGNGEGPQWFLAIAAELENGNG